MLTNFQFSPICRYIIVEYLKSKGESDAVDKSITNYKKAGEDTRM